MTQCSQGLGQLAGGYLAFGDEDEAGYICLGRVGGQRSGGVACGGAGQSLESQLERLGRSRMGIGLSSQNWDGNAGSTIWSS